MKSEDLRVGNYVSTIYPKFKYEKVNEIKEKVVYTDNIKGIGYISLKPIPLTEEILLKCNNITECDNLSDDVYKTYKISINNTELFIEIGVECDFIYVTDGVYLNINVEYLHSFQNLIFALTNKELEITL